MQIEFVNHASVVIDTGTCRILCDPWITGRAFDKGWALLSESQFQPEDFRTITHIWFSHEHPDHFSVPSLKRIPKEIASGITVLFQETRDKKVVDYCRKFGFRDVRELRLGAWTGLTEDVELFCKSHADGWGGADSWLCVRTPEATVLNLNDCDVVETNEASAISNIVGEVDVLLTQFSYASWQGNVDDVANRIAYRQEKLAEVKLQTDAVGARYVIPFASFVWFCHQDNFYLNRDVNRIDAVEEFIAAETGAEPIVMYPGDAWEVGEAHDSEGAVQRYLTDYETLNSLDPTSLPASAPVPVAALDEACAAFQVRLVESASPYAVRSFVAREQCDEEHRAGNYSRPHRLVRLMLKSTFPNVPDSIVYLQDLGQAYSFGLTTPWHAVPLEPSDCDIVTSSESLLYAFVNLYGGQSLAINGRFQEGRPGGQFNFFRFFKLAFKLNEGVVPSVSKNVGVLFDRLAGAQASP